MMQVLTLDEPSVRFNRADVLEGGGPAMTWKMAWQGLAASEAWLGHRTSLRASTRSDLILQSCAWPTVALYWSGHGNNNYSSRSHSHNFYWGETCNDGIRENAKDGDSRSAIRHVS